MYTIYIIIIVMLYMYVFVKTTLCFSKLRAYSFYFTKKKQVCALKVLEISFSLCQKSHLASECIPLIRCFGKPNKKRKTFQTYYSRLVLDKYFQTTTSL